MLEDPLSLCWDSGISRRGDAGTRGLGLTPNTYHLPPNTYHLTMTSIIPDEYYLNRAGSTTTILDEFLRLENFQRAWEKVATNRGCAGVDGESIGRFAHNQTLNIYQLRDAVAKATYQPLPCKQVIISKRNGKQRELKIPTVRDRIVQQALLNILCPLMEEKFSSASFAYRPNLSYLNAVEKVAEWRDLGYRWVLDADIVKFFDNIDHHRLLREVRLQIDNPRILCLIKSWLAAGVLIEGRVVVPQKGIPQGAVISPLLANIYLHEFDELVTGTDTRLHSQIVVETDAGTRGRGDAETMNVLPFNASWYDLKLVRYADDFLVLARTQGEILQAHSEIIKLLASMGLMLHIEKSEITNFESGLRFLGHGFLGDAIFPVDANEVSLKSALSKVWGLIKGRGDAETRGRGDKRTRGRGDKRTRGRGDAGTRRS